MQQKSTIQRIYVTTSMYFGTITQGRSVFSGQIVTLTFLYGVTCHIYSLFASITGDSSTVLLQTQAGAERWGALHSFNTSRVVTLTAAMHHRALHRTRYWMGNSTYNDIGTILVLNFTVHLLNNVSKCALNWKIKEWNEWLGKRNFEIWIAFDTYGEMMI